MSIQTAVIGGGCFWCIQSAFAQVRGVESSVAGYAGGIVAHPTYEYVCSGSSGHAEVVCVLYDEDILSYKALLSLFFALHNPTTLNQQGADRGTQYRSAIFYVDEVQCQAAQDFIRALSNRNAYPSAIVTEVTALDRFYPAEDYHQNFMEKNPRNSYCQRIVTPKLARFFSVYKKHLNFRS